MEGHGLSCDWIWPLNFPDGIWLVFLKWRETSLGIFSVKGCGFSAAVLYFNAPVLLAYTRVEDL